MSSVSEVVTLALRDGHLYGARPGTASRTLTVAGRRRHRIRLQADVFSLLYDREHAPLYYPELREAISAELDAAQAAKAGAA